jgi:hypothetical protein
MDKHYFKVPNAIFSSSLTKYELLVLVYLLRCQNNGHIIFPGYVNISKYCAISRSKARKVVTGLTEKGILGKQIKPQAYRKSGSNLCVIVLNNNTILKT